MKNLCTQAAEIRRARGETGALEKIFSLDAYLCQIIILKEHRAEFKRFILTVLKVVTFQYVKYMAGVEKVTAKI